MSTTRIPVVEKVLSVNDGVAAETRARLEAAKVFSINLPFEGTPIFSMARLRASQPPGAAG